MATVRGEEYRIVEAGDMAPLEEFYDDRLHATTLEEGTDPAAAYLVQFLKGRGTIDRLYIEILDDRNTSIGFATIEELPIAGEDFTLSLYAKYRRGGRDETVEETTQFQTPVTFGRYLDLRHEISEWACPRVVKIAFSKLLSVSRFVTVCRAIQILVDASQAGHAIPKSVRRVISRLVDPTEQIYGFAYYVPPPGVAAPEDEQFRSDNEELPQPDLDESSSAPSDDELPRPPRELRRGRLVAPRDRPHLPANVSADVTIIMSTLDDFESVRGRWQRTIIPVTDTYTVALDEDFKRYTLSFLEIRNGDVYDVVSVVAETFMDTPRAGGTGPTSIVAVRRHVIAALTPWRALFARAVPGTRVDATGRGHRAWAACLVDVLDWYGRARHIAIINAYTNLIPHQTYEPVAAALRRASAKGFRFVTARRR